MRQPAERPGVKVRTCADERAIQVAEKLAAGTAEAFHLAPGPARRLSAVAVEATRNVVNHAYVDLKLGDVEIEVVYRPLASPDGRDEIDIVITDFGNGCPFAPTAADPPGLGLSLMSELSEALTFDSRKHRGTTVGATIRVPGSDDESEERSPASHGSRFDFGDPVYLMPVVPRAVAVHAASVGATVDHLRAAIQGGRAIVDCIDHRAIAVHGATLNFDSPDESGALDVRMGPMPTGAAEPLLGRLKRGLDGAHHSSLENETDGKVDVLVSMAMA